MKIQIDKGSGNIQTSNDDKTIQIQIFKPTLLKLFIIAGIICLAFITGMGFLFGTFE